MIGFAEGFAAWLASTIVPAFLGLSIIVWAGTMTQVKYSAAFAFGIFLWFFLDTIGGAAGLDVNDGFGGGAAQAGIVALFLIGFLFFVLVDRNRGIFTAESAIGKFGIVIPLLAALAVGVHGLGEGSAFGRNISTTSSTTLLDAFGGVSAGVAYVLHKGLEPMMIGACYSVYSGGHAKSIGGRIKDTALLSAIFTIPSMLGAITGYFLTYDSTYFFALGTGTSIYAALRLAAPLFSTENYAAKASVKLSVTLLLGFLAIYFAALFHS